MRVAFAGLGNMGAPMAARLIAAGHDLAVFDADPVALARFVAGNACRRANDPADLAREAEAVVTMLPTSAIVGDLLDAALPALRPGAIVLEMSSGVPAQTRSIAARVEAAGGRLVDAPVSGGVPRARDGSLAIMVGGDEAAVDTARPLLEALGASIMPTGAVGTAHAMKALNNLVSAGGFLIGIEALLIGARAGLDPAVMVDVLNASTGVNNSTQKKFKQYVLSRSFDAGFGLDLMLKDLTIAMQVAEETETAAPFAGHCRAMWAAARAMLGAGQDHTAMARLSEALAGQELKSALS